MFHKIDFPARTIIYPQPALSLASLLESGGGPCQVSVPAGGGGTDGNGGRDNEL